MKKVYCRECKYDSGGNSKETITTGCCSYKLTSVKTVVENEFIGNTKKEGYDTYLNYSNNEFGDCKYFKKYKNYITLYNVIGCIIIILFILFEFLN